MSCLNLRLPPANKAWKSFTSKLQNKLHKLNKSKNIKKTRHHFNPSSISTKSVPYIKPSSSILSNHSKKRRFFNPFKPRRTRKRYFLQKKTAPVYIDRLFVGPLAADQEVMVKSPAREQKGNGKGSEGDKHGDDMWESLGFASPQMRGINERAEQFIASFRAELEVQELIDTDLCKDNATS